MQSSRILLTQLRLLASLKSGSGDNIRQDTATSRFPLRTPDTSPDKTLMKGNSNTPNSHQQRGNSAAIPATPSGAQSAKKNSNPTETIFDESSAHNSNANNIGGVQVDVGKMTQAAEVLKAAVSTAFQPTLRRLILGCDGSFVLSLSYMLELLPSARARSDYIYRFENVFVWATNKKII